jgi:hypothetical protein
VSCTADQLVRRTAHPAGRRITQTSSYLKERRYRVIGLWTFQLVHEHQERTGPGDRDTRSCVLTVFRQHEEWPSWRWQRIHHWFTLEEIKDKTS